uniref:Transposase IS30-like HTH domain-containing protein n=1 Tax=Oreochromis aureus TaxID=47969 RepID=A0AAZ1XJT5_OREAU
MVSKRQLTMEDRQTIITLKNVGLSYREISTKVKVSVSTVSFTMKRHSETNCDRKRSGRPKATTESEDKFLRVNSLFSVSTVKRRLRANRTKRLAWAMKHGHWTTEDLPTEDVHNTFVLWTD